MSSFVGAIAVADLVKSTLGPKGMDKILSSVTSASGEITITNDGATILRSIHVDNAAAKVLVDISRIQDEEVGDGTTSVAVLCGELLRQAEDLIAQRIHPITIIEGFRQAANIARATLEGMAVDNSADEAAFKDDLHKIAQTTLSSKLVHHEKEYFASLAVDAVLRLKGSGKFLVVSG
jgi:T-complex protein 1 subunit beta